MPCAIRIRPHLSSKEPIMKRCLLPVVAWLAIAGTLSAEIKSKPIAYQDGDLQLEGYYAWDDAVSGKRPGIIIVHEWWGLNDYARHRADQLARLGYAAFAVDMYGKGKLTEHPTEAREWAAQVRKNVDAWQQRALAGLNVLKQQEQCDTTRIAAMGYCFGGSTALQMAYTGADLKGVVTFHGALPIPDESQAKAIKARILVCHGSADRFIPQDVIEKFQHMLDQAGADWTMVYYAGARHSFTDPDADKHNVDGMKYQKAADERSWKEMQEFYKEIFAK
jgi:dienelactone hydrolase